MKMQLKKCVHQTVTWLGKCVPQPIPIHVETVVLLSQQKPDDTIEIDLDLDELGATSAETKATYQEIKDYVLKEFGLKVSNLYISQVKRKCGIEVGENYNLPKSENARPLPTPKSNQLFIVVFTLKDASLSFLNGDLFA